MARLSCSVGRLPARKRVIHVVGLWSEQAPAFLVATGIVSILALGIPMLLVPLTWASWLSWPIPQTPDGRDLSTYLGRCLGALICVQATVVLFAAGNASLQPVIFAILIGDFVLMVALHAWGAARKIQPRSESLETFAWAVALVLALLFFPA